MVRYTRGQQQAQTPTRGIPTSSYVNIKGTTAVTLFPHGSVLSTFLSLYVA